MPDSAPILKRLREILSISGDRVGKARRISAAIRETVGYRWVGIYDVSEDEIGVVAWSGPKARVTRDTRHLTTLGTTRSEIVVPVLKGGGVVGLLDVESDLTDAFSEEDRRFLEECAVVL
ncbi:MAG TPA: GAF domain-containing protein, partial [Methylomirabilota bacterium]|nr:GAF domain-containing protein [Methylomirabilota bacterium]